MEVKKVLGDKKRGLKYLYISKNSDIQVGDFVKIIKVKEEDMEDEKRSDDVIQENKNI